MVILCVNRFIVTHKYSQLLPVKRLARPVRSCAPPSMTTATGMCFDAFRT